MRVRVASRNGHTVLEVVGGGTISWSGKPCDSKRHLVTARFLDAWDAYHFAVAHKLELDSFGV